MLYYGGAAIRVSYSLSGSRTPVPLEAGPGGRRVLREHKRVDHSGRPRDHPEFRLKKKNTSASLRFMLHAGDGKYGRSGSYSA